LGRSAANQYNQQYGGAARFYGGSKPKSKKRSRKSLLKSKKSRSHKKIGKSKGMRSPVRGGSSVSHLRL
jgi:hypothetical protein